MAVTVQCPHCQAKLALKSESSLGKKLACPKCKKPFKAEAPPEDDDMAFLNDMDVEDDSSRDEDEEEEQEQPEERPVRSGKAGGKKGKKKSFNPMPMIFGGLGILVALAFLAGFGILVWNLVNGMGGASELAWIPGDADVIGKVKVREFAQTPFAQSIFSGNTATEVDKNLNTAFGLALADVESVTFGMKNATSTSFMSPMAMASRPQSGSFVIRASKTLDPEKIRQATGMSVATTGSGRTYYKSAIPARTGTLYFPSGTMMVVADDATMQSLLATNGAAPSRPELSVVNTSANVYVAAIPDPTRPRPEMRPTDRLMFGAASNEQIQALQKVKVSVIEVTAGQDLSVVMRWSCDDNATAALVQGLYDAQITNVKQLFENPLVAMQMGSSSNVLKEIAASVKTSASGNTGSLSLTVPSKVKDPISEFMASMSGSMPSGRMPGTMPASDPNSLNSLNLPMGDPAAQPMPTTSNSNSNNEPKITPTAVPLVLP